MTKLKQDIVLRTMEASGLKQAQIAEQMGVTQAYVSKMKQGRATLERILELAHICGQEVRFTVEPMK